MPRYCLQLTLRTLSFSATRATAWCREFSYCPLSVVTAGSGVQADTVRFYGQGLNCGLEDVRVFNAYLEKHKISATTSRPLGETDPQLEVALSHYSEDRDEDLKAILELAMQN